MSTYRAVGEIDLDARRRASFGKIGRKEHKRYRVEEAENGELHLIPLVSVPITDLQPWKTKEEFDAAMNNAIEQARNGEGVAMDFSDASNDDES